MEGRRRWVEVRGGGGTKEMEGRAWYERETVRAKGKGGGDMCIGGWSDGRTGGRTERNSRPFRCIHFRKTFLVRDAC